MPASLLKKIVSNEDAFYLWDRILCSYQNGFPNAINPGDKQQVRANIALNAGQEILFDIVWNQFEVNIRTGLNPGNEGFHVAQPWNGDIKEASVLFLGSNPGFTPRACAPRYFGGDRFRWNGTQFCNLGEITNGIEGVRDFFDKRFQENAYSVVRAKGKFTVALDNGTNRPTDVKYWNKMYEFLQQLYGMTQEPGETCQDFTRRVMKKGICTEVIPFVSQSEEDLMTPELYDYCWKEFSSKILKLSKASLIVLVGRVARETILEAAFSRDRNNAANVSLFDADVKIGKKVDARDALMNGRILGYRSNGETREVKVITVKHFSRTNERPPAPDFLELGNALRI